MLELVRQKLLNKKSGILNYLLDRTSVRNCFGRSNAEVNTMKDCLYYANSSCVSKQLGIIKSHTLRSRLHVKVRK